MYSGTWQAPSMKSCTTWVNAWVCRHPTQLANTCKIAIYHHMHDECVCVIQALCCNGIIAVFINIYIITELDAILVTTPHSYTSHLLCWISYEKNMQGHAVWIIKIIRVLERRTWISDGTSTVKLELQSYFVLYACIYRSILYLSVPGGPPPAE